MSGVNSAARGRASEGWRELLSRSSEALPQFSRNKDETHRGSSTLATFLRWSLLAGEVEETGKEIVVRVESRHGEG